MSVDQDYSSFEPGSDEFVARLVEDHMGWATSIAKSVARGWNMDWQLDGLDGGAYEGLLFCAKRFDPARGVPFRGYARRRIHEACTEEARKSKTWQRGTGGDAPGEQEAREVSAKLFDVFPELRTGILPGTDEDGRIPSIRSSIRTLLAGASLIAAFQESGSENPEIALEYKELIGILSNLESVHQEILWAVYYKDQSMRNLADEWQVDDLSVIREHKEILTYLSSRLEGVGGVMPKTPKIRRGLRAVAQRLRKENIAGTFTKLAAASVIVFTLYFTVFAQTILVL
jgi:DNA-directed RNA polymerase specialized sigma subunit